jgi:hypothetical protein
MPDAERIEVEGTAKLQVRKRETRLEANLTYLPTAYAYSCILVGMFSEFH